MATQGKKLEHNPGRITLNSKEEYRCEDTYTGDGFRTVFLTTLSRHFDMPKRANLTELLLLDGAKFVERYRITSATLPS